jgi:hypothetical protein
MSGVIARRELELESDLGDLRGLVEVQAPIHSDDAPEWRCNYRIAWPGFEWNHAICGGDSYQALLLTLQMIPVIIQTSDDFKTNRLRWKAHFVEFEGRQVQSQTFDEAFGLKPLSSGSVQ